LYRPRTPGYSKRDPERRWAVPDRVFFAAGACHILAYAFLRRYPAAGARALWLRPESGVGNHIFVAGRDWAFDYHGYAPLDRFLAHSAARAGRLWPGWQATRVELPAEILISEAKSKTYDGLWLREPGQFLHDALPRAEAFLDRFPPPSGCGALGLVHAAFVQAPVATGGPSGRPHSDHEPS
jgi:hypothetical protein